MDICLTLCIWITGNASFNIFLLSGAEEHFYIIFILGHSRWSKNSNAHGWK